MKIDIDGTRARYIPANAVKVTAKTCKALFYLSTRNGKPTAIAFLGNARKPSWHYRFDSEATREKRINLAIQSQLATEMAANERKATHKAEALAPVALKIGDILDCSWGYEQTNVDFYQVIALIGTSMVEVREVAQVRTPNGCHDQGTCVPVIGKFVGAPERYKVIGKERNAIKPASYSWASKWNGKPRFFSTYA